MRDGDGEYTRGAAVGEYDRGEYDGEYDRWEEEYDGEYAREENDDAEYVRADGVEYARLNDDETPRGGPTTRGDAKVRAPAEAEIVRGAADVKCVPAATRPL